MKNDERRIRMGLWTRWLNAMLSGDLVKAGVLHRWYLDAVNK